MWVVGLMDFTRKAVDKQFGYHNGYRDRKFALMGVSSSDWLQLRFQGKTKSQILVLCEGPCPHNRCAFQWWKHMFTCGMFFSLIVINVNLSISCKI